MRHKVQPLICGIVHPTKNEIKQIIELVKDVDLIGISVVSTLYPISKKLTDTIHKELEIPVVWGSSHAIINPEECIETADYVCIGEGEKAILDLALGRPLKSIKNIWYWQGKKIIKNKRAKLENIELLPNLDYSNKNKFVIDESGIKQERIDYLKDKKYLINKQGVGAYDPMNINPYITYMTSRGCPFSCDFCSNNIFRKLYKGCGKFLRRKSVNKVIEELKGIMKYRQRVDAIIFIDDLFLFDIGWLREFCKAYKKEINLPFVIEAYPNVINEENISILSDAGLRGASVGVQHWKNLREKLFNRFTPDEQIIKINNILHKYGVIPKYDFIVDIPGETERDRIQLLNLILKLKRPFELNLFSMIHFPKTDLTTRFMTEGKIKEKDLEGNSTIGIDFPNDLKIKAKRKPYKSLILLYAHLGLPRNVLKFFYKNKFLRDNSWILLYLVDVMDKTKYSMYNVLKMVGLYYPIREFYRKRKRELLKGRGLIKG